MICYLIVYRQTEREREREGGGRKEGGREEDAI